MIELSQNKDDDITINITNIVGTLESSIILHNEFTFFYKVFIHNSNLCLDKHIRQSHLESTEYTKEVLLRNLTVQNKLHKQAALLSF